MTPDALMSGLGAATRALVGRHALLADPVPPAFRSRRGDWGGRPLLLETELWRGDGDLARLKIAVIRTDDGGVCSLTVLALGRADRSAPIFGADLLSFGGRLTTVVVDLAPTVRRTREDARDRIGLARDLALARGEARRWTSPTETPFSADVLFMTPAAGAEPAIERAYLTYLHAFQSELGVVEDSGVPSVEEVTAAQRLFLTRLRQVKRQNKALAKLFGAQWTHDYFDEVFFAETRTA